MIIIFLTFKRCPRWSLNCACSKARILRRRFNYFGNNLIIFHIYQLRCCPVLDLPYRSIKPGSVIIHHFTAVLNCCYLWKIATNCDASTLLFQSSRAGIVFPFFSRGEFKFKSSDTIAPYLGESFISSALLSFIY